MSIPNHQRCRDDNSRRKGYGPTSFWVQDPKAIFTHLALEEGTTFVDAGCGAGEYSLYAARLLGEKGRVIALDTAQHSVEWLNANSREKGAADITAHICDITSGLPLETHSADVVMLGTVLHIKSVRDRAKTMFSEIKRILRPNGLLAVLECRKVEANFGPPLHSRLSPKDVEALTAPCGFVKHSVLTLEHTYLACFEPR
ncbi:class I SAM-dependent methyltransferase [uncultured Pseudodesulfovibrio sp.]|uniref:class I SAM-dependent methyltransferase n=1 Tax=uncultured Pseudodesulfovibrio sp. TaxID=2035858 RepID=UPI0029C6DB95|nr:class I SAM-dependent methyltransferase [uncultured Pseudodesulfovibrio sp.]